MTFSAPLTVLLAVLATWRITHLLNAEDGPFDLFARLRRWVGQGFWGKLLDCFYCLSLWVSAPFALWLGSTWGERLLLWLALSAGAILIQLLAGWVEAETYLPALYHEDAEVEDALLQRQTPELVQDQHKPDQRRGEPG